MTNFGTSGRRPGRSHRILGAAGLLAILAAPASVAPAQPITKMASVPSLGIAAGPDGAVWTTGPQGTAINRFDPATKAVKQFTDGFAQAVLQGIVAGSDGNLWFGMTATTMASIGRITPSGVVTLFPTGASGGSALIVASRTGRLLFNIYQNGAQGAIGAVDLPFGLPAAVSVPYVLSHAPGPLTEARDGTLWYTVSDAPLEPTTGGRVGRLSPNGSVAEFWTGPGSKPYFPAEAVDGAVWTTDLKLPVFHRVSRDGDVTHYSVPDWRTGGSNGSPYFVGLVAGPDGNLWAPGDQRVARITPGGTITVYSVPDMAMGMDARIGPDGAVWLAATNGIYRVTPPAGTPCQPSDYAACLMGSRYKAEATWKDYGGNTGRGRVVPLTSDTAYFWFFSAANVELFAKIVDQCSQPGPVRAVYAGGMTDVEVTLTVTDTVTNTPRVYFKPLGTPFTLIQDAAFQCP